MNGNYLLLKLFPQIIAKKSLWDGKGVSNKLCCLERDILAPALPPPLEIRGFWHKILTAMDWHKQCYPSLISYLPTDLS